MCFQSRLINESFPALWHGGCWHSKWFKAIKKTRFHSVFSITNENPYKFIGRKCDAKGNAQYSIHDLFFKHRDRAFAQSNNLPRLLLVSLSIALHMAYQLCIQVRKDIHSTEPMVHSYNLMLDLCLISNKGLNARFYALLNTFTTPRRVMTLFFLQERIKSKISFEYSLELERVSRDFGE